MLVVILISGNAHLPVEVIWNHERTLPPSAVLLLSCQFPFLCLSLCPETISHFMRSQKARGAGRDSFLFLLNPSLLCSWECCCCCVSGLQAPWWMGAGDSTMGPVIILILMSFLYSGAVSWRSEVYFNETAELPCQFSNSQNLSLNELVIFWQYKEELVLYEHYLGKENFNNVNSKYKHRTSFDRNNWTLQLHRAQIKDEGIYQCVIHHKKPTGLLPIHRKEVELSLFANFTQPEIVQMSNVTSNSGINLTCSSGQGYPKPMMMYFLLKLENSTEFKDDGIMQTSQNNDTELYNVSISAYFPFPDDMSNMTIFCVLKTKAMKSEQRKLFSKPFCRVPSHPAPVTHQPSWIPIAPLIPVIFSVGMVYFVWKKKKKQRAVDTNKETTRMKKENNEGTGERVKIQVPERNDKEVQCT